MKIRILIGETENYDSKMLCSNAYIEIVAFPMKDMTYYGDDEDKDLITLHNEEELKEWAEIAFLDYEIWEPSLPEGAIIEDDQK